MEGATVLVADGQGHREFATNAAGEARMQVVLGMMNYGVLADDRGRQQGHQTVGAPEGHTLEFVLYPGAQAVGRLTDAAHQETAAAEK